MTATDLAVDPQRGHPFVAERSDGRARRVFTATLGRAVPLAVLLVVWQIAANTFFAGTFALAAPSDVARDLYDNWERYWPSVASTVRIAILGFTIGNVIAIVLAVAVVQFRWIERPLTRAVLAVYCIPMIALAPILQVLLREGDQAKIALSALAVVFTTMVATILGLRSADPRASELVAVLGGTSWTVLRKVRVRASLPSLMAGLRVAAPAAVLGATVAEFLGADRGLGVLIVNSLSSLDTTRVWTVAVIATAVSWAGLRRGRDRRPTRQRVDPPADVPRAPRAAPSRRGVPSTIAACAWGALWTTALLITLWAIGIHVSGLDSFFAKGPLDVWRLLTTGDQASADRELLLAGLGTTLTNVFAGLVAGVITACALAVIFVLAPIVARRVMPVALVLRSIPIIATIPLVILVLGRGFGATTATVAIMSFFPTLVNVTTGLRSAPAEVVELLTVYDVSPITIVQKARIPAAMPNLFVSIRISQFQRPSSAPSWSSGWQPPMASVTPSWPAPSTLGTGSCGRRRRSSAA